MEAFWGLAGFGLMMFLIFAGVALILVAGKEKTSSVEYEEEVSDDSGVVETRL